MSERTELDRLPPRPERGGLPMTYAPQFALIVYNTSSMPETLRELNKQAVKDGLLLPAGQSLRKDYSQKLGKPLSPLEYRLYEFISELTPQGPVSARVLIKEFYSQCDGILDSDRSALFNLIERVREKLGTNAIINRRGLGYLSRRTLINIGAPTRN